MKKKNSTLKDLERLRRKLQKEYPSDSIVDAVIFGKWNVEYEFKCKKCNRKMPQYYLDIKEVCFDCKSDNVSLKSLVGQ